MPGLECVEVNPGGSPDRVVIWLHGLGADGNDFEPIVRELSLPEAMGVRFVFPHAPMRTVTINNGLLMRAWYDIYDLDLAQQDEDGIRESERAVALLVENESAAGIPPERIVLAGFSQGGAIALQTALRYPKRLAGVLALSCYLPLAETLEREAAEENAQIPIFMAHGLNDPVVPLQGAEMSREFLEGRGYPVEWRTYPMDHSVCLEEVQHIAAWFQRILRDS